MGFRSFTREAFAGTADRVKSAGGDTSYAGREEIKRTGKLHPLVDPAGYGLVRKSLPRYVELPDGRFHNLAGIPMPVETALDTTGSMGENVALAFNSLPKLYDMLTTGTHPVLGRYDVQIANGIFADGYSDIFVAARSQFEMEEKIAEQLTLMVPEKGGGGNGGEDPDYLMFSSAFLTEAHICEYGLKGYHFMVTDEPTHNDVNWPKLVSVFGDTVLDVVAENAKGNYIVDAKSLPGTQEIVATLKNNWHAFAIIVGRNGRNPVFQHWQKYYGVEHVITVDSTEVLPYVEALVIGLTEGVIDLQGAAEYLVSVGCNRSTARELAEAVSVIPVGAQTLAKNFSKIPKKGMVYANKRDLWPVADGTIASKEEAPSKWL